MLSWKLITTQDNWGGNCFQQQAALPDYLKKMPIPDNLAMCKVPEPSITVGRRGSSKDCSQIFLSAWWDWRHKIKFKLLQKVKKYIISCTLKFVNNNNSNYHYYKYGNNSTFVSFFQSV